MLAMASGGGKEEHQPGLMVKQGSKLHAKMLSKEAAAQLAAPSFRVYYSVASAGAVPFLWESQPGTPKHDSPSAAALPPLTPPPSYYSSAGRAAAARRRRPGGLLAAILPRITLGGRRTAPAAACSSWSSSSWSSSSSGSTTMSPVFTVQSPSPAVHGHHRRAFSAGGDDDDEEEEAAATPRCFWTERDCCERRVVKGCGVAVAVRNALATVVGGGKPGRRAAA